MRGWIGFDAATVTGYAYVAGRTTQYWVTGVLDALDRMELEHVVQAAVDAGCTHAAIEDPYLGANVATLKKLTRIADRIQSQCERCGMKVLLITAQKWQSALDISGKRADRKLGARRMAAHLTGSEPQTQDEADAVCLTYVAASNAWLEQQVKERGR